MKKKELKSNKIEITINGLNVTIIPGKIYIQWSYLIKKRKEMKFVLEYIQRHLNKSNITIDTPLNYRSIDSIVNTWITQNNLFWCGYKPASTSSLELNIKQPLYKTLFDLILSRIIL